jgi:hypothetical protein
MVRLAGMVCHRWRVDSGRVHTFGDVHGLRWTNKQGPAVIAVEVRKNPVNGRAGWFVHSHGRKAKVR